MSFHVPRGGGASTLRRGVISGYQRPSHIYLAILIELTALLKGTTELSARERVFAEQHCEETDIAGAT